MEADLKHATDIFVERGKWFEKWFGSEKP